MWMIVMGGDSTSKGAVVDYLVKQEKFEYIPLDKQESTTVAIEREIRFGGSYLTTHMMAQENARIKDVVTVRSFWEWAEIFPQVLVKRGELSESDARVIKVLYESIKVVLKPPTAVVYMHPSQKMTMYDRALLNNKQPDDERMTTLLKLYEGFVQKIKIPVIEIDASEPMERMKSSLEFGLASLRASKLTDDSFWKKVMFHG